MASWASNKTAIHECSNWNCLFKKRKRKRKEKKTKKTKQNKTNKKKNTLSRSNQHQSLLILARDLHDVISHAFNLTVSHEHTHVAAIKKISCYAWQLAILKHHILCTIYDSLTFRTSLARETSSMQKAHLQHVGKKNGFLRAPVFREYGNILKELAGTNVMFVIPLQCQ